ncbi:hypothetical protein B0T40_24350 [Chromobacterium haemolyticum]|uniref:retron Se72 family effector protein n=1 Tax=Chromobacterium haemolyticum TaxID=394935 RepID=UPI0009DB5F62|nr:retron Se72 family effector protein [Chromobacterium haemolyticum]OQS30884.1 hypothetical protein B0T40_24350 [Chromobacterium haemolyticum]
MTNQSSVPEYGTVKCYFPLKGYGFITREKGKDLFFFFKDLLDEKTIFEGAKVAFSVESTLKGPRAIKVTRVG